MNKEVRATVAALGVLVLSGCASVAPKHYEVTSSRVYEASYDQVWSNLVAILAKANVPLKQIAKDSGVIYVDALKFDDRQADCGSPGMLKPIARFGTVNILVQPVGNRQQVTVNTSFTETRYNGFDYSTSQVQCNSKGQFEAALLDAIGRGTPVGSVAANPVAQGGPSRSIDEQLDELNRQQLPYDEYQKRYRAITGQ
ncbi:hypothetical protein [Pseudomonas sp. AU12215]|uniref:hypothetical protein n=1 Tax=Pseudomonas sp. AU12215 TaxID=1860123 RepID=UPI0007EE6E26|nr:hypothetical protein [Pseudomonas sp. AU12215]OBY58221.1 hypothetical protein A9513_012010 [Pseudomonas sp. AU12215]